MKTTMNISVEKGLKESFSVFAKSIWTNPTNLINMLMQDAVNHKRVNFSWNPYLDIDIESFSKEELEDLKNSKSIIESTEVIKNVLSNRKKLL